MAEAAAALSTGEVALVLANLAGDVPSLCAAACVSRAWRTAAAAPALWTRLERLPPAAARRLNTERLIWLVARAAGGLERLDLSGADGVGDAGLDTALQQPHALTHFVADSDCSMLSASVVAEALASRSGHLLQLTVAGVAVGPETPWDEDSDDERERAADAFMIASDEVIDALRALLAPGGVLDGDQMCEGRDRELCIFLCGLNSTCAKCKTALCADHEKELFADCTVCGKPFCGNYCMHGEVCDACLAAAAALNDAN
jgi:hypothetical protein